MSEETTQNDKPRMQENFALLQGNLGKDPELKFFESGTSYCKFDIANSDDYLNTDDERVERTNWSPIFTTGKLAEACAEYLKKGSEVMVRGKLEQRRWKNDDGDNRSMLQLRAARVIFMDRRNGNGGSREEVPDGPEDDIPF